MTIKKGDTVKIKYTGKLDDGTVFDSSDKHDHPLEFKVGEGQVIKGFDAAVEGMKKDEKKSIKLKPKDAYGDKNPELVQKVPKDQFPTEPQKGMTFVMQLPTGHQVPAQVIDVSEKEVTLDLNHPLAGQNLNFDIEVLEVS